MAGGLFGSRSDSERDAWIKKRENWQRNNPASEVDDTDDDE